MLKIYFFNSQLNKLKRDTGIDKTGLGAKTSATARQSRTLECLQVALAASY